MNEFTSREETAVRTRIDDLPAVGEELAPEQLQLVVGGSLARLSGPPVAAPVAATTRTTAAGADPHTMGGLTPRAGPGPGSPAGPRVTPGPGPSLTRKRGASCDRFPANEDLPMILIVAEHNDPHADQVAAMLRRHRSGIQSASPRPTSRRRPRWPCRTPPTGEARHTLRVGGERIGAPEPPAVPVWYRLGAYPVAPPHLTEQHHRDYVAEEARCFLHDAWHSLDPRWVPAPHFVVQRAQLKAAQLKVAGAAGVRTAPDSGDQQPRRVPRLLPPTQRAGGQQAGAASP